MKGEKGITLIALVITIIVLLIVSGIAITATTGTKQNISDAKYDLIKAELSEVQHAVLEIYIKYMQTGNSNILAGEKIEYSEAQSELNQLSSTLTLRAENYDNQEKVSAEKYYYKLDTNALEKIGVKKSQEEYIVNYSTGEVFNCLTKVTGDNEALYVYAN